MIMELINTSAPRGLKAGSRGFTTVAQTKGMPAWLSETLERLSGYRFVAEVVGSDTERNPIVYRHARLARGSESYSVLSRIAPCPTDYSGRSNRIAHHLVLDAREQVKAGPAWLVGRDDLFRSEWNEEPRMLDPLRNRPDADLKPARCRAWQRATGDAGWAGETLRRWLRRPDQPLYVRHLAGCEMLELLAEAAALLPSDLRWKLTFQTCVTDDVPTGVTCALRCVPQIAGVRTDIRGIAAHNTLDLVTRVAPADSEYAEKARRGELIATAVSASGGTRKVSVAASRATATPGTATALEEKSEIADAQYELVSLEDTTLGDGLSAGPVPHAPTPAVRDQRRRDLVMLAIGAVGAAVAMFAIAVGLKLLRSPETTDLQEIPRTVVEQSREETGIVEEQRQPGAAKRVASPPATQPVVENTDTLAHVSEQKSGVASMMSVDSSEVLQVPVEGLSAGGRVSAKESDLASAAESGVEPVRWTRAEITKDEFADFKFDPAIVVSIDEDAKLATDWLTDDGALQVAWLTSADGSPAEVRGWKLEDGQIIENPANPFGDASIENERKPVVELKTEPTPGGKLSVSFRVLAKEGLFAELAGLCIRHPSQNRAILMVRRSTQLDPIKLQEAQESDRSQDDAEGADTPKRDRYEGLGTVRNWNWVRGRNRLWEYTKKGSRYTAKRRGAARNETVFSVEIDDALSKDATIAVFITPKAMPEPADDDARFLKELRTALQRTNKEAQRLTTLPNVYGVPMIELVFPGRAEKKPAPQPSTDNPNSDRSKETTPR